MALIREAVGSEWTSDLLSDDSMKNMTRRVSEEEWTKIEQEFHGNMEGFKLIETSAEDMIKIEELLGAPKGFFKSPVMIKTSEQFCSNCHRENNFLDVVATGLRVHSPKFLKDVFSGEYGHILNTQQNQPCFCFQCKNLLPKTAAKYSAPKVLGTSLYQWSWPIGK